MAVTTNAQDLTEIAQAGEANACCLALGGDIVVDTGTGQELCSFETYEYDLELACQTAQQYAQTLPSPQQQSGGNWLANNLVSVIDSLGSAGSQVINALEGNTGGNQYGTQPPIASGSKKNRGWIVGLFVLLIVAGVFYMLRKKK